MTTSASASRSSPAATMLQRRDFVRELDSGKGLGLEAASGKEFRPKLYRAERVSFKWERVPTNQGHADEAGHSLL